MRGSTARATICALLVAAAVGHADTVVVKAGRVLTMAGSPLERGAVLIEDGKIKRVAPDIQAPDGATVIEVPGGVVMPGIVDANARFGIRGDANEQSSEITPAFSIADALVGDDAAVQHALQLGTTTIRLVPGNSNLIAGSGVICKTAGGPLGATPIAADGSLKLVMGNDAAGGNRTPRSGRPDSFYYRQPTTRMGVVWALRQALFGVQQALDAKAELTADQAALAAAMQGKTPIHIALRSAVDVETTFQIVDEFKLKNLVFLECTEGHKMAAEIARRGVPVVLGPYYFYPRNYAEYSEGGAVNLNNAGILADAGVDIAFASNDPGGPTDLLTVAAMAVRNGLDPEAALRAVTVAPARIIGIADRVGTIEKGKDADLIVLSGEPLSVTSRIEKVIVDGRIAFDVESGANTDG